MVNTTWQIAIGLVTIYHQNAGFLISQWVLVMARRSAAFERVVSAAVGAKRLAGSFNRQENPRMRIPQQHRWHRTMEWQVVGSYFDFSSFIIGLGLLIHTS